MTPLSPTEVKAYYHARLPDLRQTGAEWRCPCPIHEGKRDSFSVNAETGVWCCHSACGRGGSIADLEMQLNACDFKAAAREIEKIIGRPSKNGNHSARKTIAYYVYHDEHGNPLFRVCRTEPKDFYQQRWDGKKFVKGLGDTRRVLYHLPELVNAERKTVLVCEGEKDADALRDREFTATCNPMGAEKWRDEHAETLRGWEHVVIIQHDDEAGRHHAQQVAESLRGKVGDIRIVPLPVPPDRRNEGYDAFNFFEDGHTAEELKDLVEATPPLEDPPRKRLERAATIPPATPAARSTSGAIQTVVETFDRWLYLPNRKMLYATLGCVAANLMPGDPVWLMLVGPPSCGKTEILCSLLSLPHTHLASTLTEASLLSGTPNRDKAKGSRGGLLRNIGEFGFLIAKDFTSVLSMSREARPQLLAALREIFDGQWVRNVGTDGGKTLAWAGKVAMLAGVTPTIDRHHGVMGAMGERFVFCRFPDLDEGAYIAAAVKHLGAERKMRDELAAVVAGLFADLRIPDSYPPFSSEAIDRLTALCKLGVRLRSAVERDYRGEIELIPDPEAPSRLALVLRRLLAGMELVGVPTEEAWRVLGSIVMDSAPKIRRQALALLAERGEQSTSDIAARLGYPSATTRRALEDLVAHRIGVRAPQGKGKPDLWRLHEWAEMDYSTLDLRDGSEAERN